MFKTPVMVLQELGQKNGFLPKYAEITQCAGTHSNWFTVKVQCKDLKATGSALTKKEAKQNAAREMLTMLQPSNNADLRTINSTSNPNDNENTDSHPMSLAILENQDFQNYVGVLQELCIKSKLSIPVYDECGIVKGSNDQMLFVISCTVNAITENASAVTKKKAKQEAARKVYVRLKDTANVTMNIKSKSNHCFKISVPDLFNQLSINISDLKTESSFMQKTNFVSDRINLRIHDEGITEVHNTTINNCHLYFKSIYFNKINDSVKKNLSKMLESMSETVTFKNTNNHFTYQKILQYIQDIFHIQLKRVSFKCYNLKIIGFHFNLLEYRLSLFQIGIGKNEIDAEIKALANIIQTILLLMD